jgi:hypothetical protein
MTRCWNQLDIPETSFEVFGISLGYPKFNKPGIGYPKSMKDILKTENLEWDIPKLMNYKSRVSFFVPG